MKPPMCKLCGKAHWTYEEHGAGEAVPEYIQEMVGGRTSSAAEAGKAAAPVAVARVPKTEASAVEPARSPVTQKTCNACNKPYNNRGKVCNACRQAAYRERSRG